MIREQVRNLINRVPAPAEVAVGLAVAITGGEWLDATNTEMNLASIAETSGAVGVLVLGSAVAMDGSWRVGHRSEERRQNSPQQPTVDLQKQQS